SPRPLAYNGPPTGATLVRQPTAGPWHDGIAAGPDGRADAWPSGRAAVRFAGWTRERLERCTTGRPAAGPPSPCLLHGRHAVADDPPSGHGPLCQYRIDSWPPGIKTQRVDREDTGYWITRLSGTNCSRSRNTRRGRATRAAPASKTWIRKWWLSHSGAGSRPS